jgi:hypothetical protein
MAMGRVIFHSPTHHTFAFVHDGAEMNKLGSLRPLLSNIKNWLTIFIITLKVIGDGDQQWLQRPIPLDSPFPSAWSP